MYHVFMINPKAGNYYFAMHIRQLLDEIPNFEHYCFNIRNEGYEEELTKQILKYFDDQKVRLYIVGGLGTVHKVLNALDGNFDRVEIAWIATGKNNNFLRHLGADMKTFMDVKATIDGRPVRMDYIRTNHGIALNALSIGIDAKIMEVMSEMTVFRAAKGLQQSIALIYSAFASKPIYMRLSLNGMNVSGRFSELFFGNGGHIGSGLRFGFDTNTQDGLADYLITPDTRGLPVLIMLKKITTKEKQEVAKECRIGKCKKITIDTDRPMSVNLDGQLYKDYNHWEAEIVRDGITVIIPKGVGNND